MKRKTRKAPKDGKPRYSANEHPLYHITYNRLKQNSVFLSESIRSNSFHDSNVLHGIGECKGSLIELTGNDKGYYLKEENWYEALIPSALKALRKVKAEFKRWQDGQVRSGLAIIRPKEYPKDLLEKRLKAEALLDIRYAEKKAVVDRLKELQERKQKAVEKNILPFGPQGHLPKAGQTITNVDGQNVSYSEEGIPFINEPSSPYHGMPIFHYRQMCKDWKRKMGLMPDQLREKAQQIFLEKKELAKAEGTAPPLFPPVVSEFKIGQWMERLGISKEDYPEWPEDATSLVPKSA